MDLINEKKIYPQKVEVVNELNAKVESSESNPLNISFPQTFVNGSGNSVALKVFPVNTPQWVFCRPNNNNFNLHISSIHVVNASVGTVFPVDLYVYNVPSSSIANHVNAVYGTFSSRYPNASSIVIFYETISNGGVVSADSYSSSDSI